MSLKKQQPLVLLLLLLLPFLLAAAETRGAPSTSNRTSFVIVLCDDLGFGDVGFHNSPNRTPNLDEMAQSPHTLRMDNFHSGSNICSPSRASLLSGRNPRRDCVDTVTNDFSKNPSKHITFHSDMPSIALDAKKAGYATAFFGKWHLGSFGKHGPGALGFDYWAATLQSAVTYDPSCVCDTLACTKTCFAYALNTSLTPCCSTVYSPMDLRCCKPGTDGQSCYTVSRQKAQCSSQQLSTCYFGNKEAGTKIAPQSKTTCGLTIGTNGAIGPFVERRFPPRVKTGVYLTEQAIEFISSLPSPSTPFLVELAFHEPHIPVVTSPNNTEACKLGLASSYCPKALSNVRQIAYYGGVGHVDESIGLLRTFLRTFSGGARHNNTMIIFMSDNGPDIKNIGLARPFQGHKYSLYEGGHRVPGLVEWPARIRENYVIPYTATDQLTSMMDVRPTLLAVLQEENPSINFDVPTPGQVTDGLSWLPLIDSPRNWTRPTPFFMCKPRSCLEWTVIVGNLKLIRLVKNNYILLDLSKDVAEKDNLVQYRKDDFYRLKRIADEIKGSVQHDHDVVHKCYQNTKK